MCVTRWHTWEWSRRGHPQLGVSSNRIGRDLALARWAQNRGRRSQPRLDSWSRTHFGEVYPFAGIISGLSRVHGSGRGCARSSYLEGGLFRTSRSLRIRVKFLHT